MVRGKKHGLFSFNKNVGRPIALLIWNVGNGGRLVHHGVKQDGAHFGETYVEADFRGASWAGCHSSYPVLLGDNRNGGWIRKLRHNESVAGRWHHYGCKYRNDSYVLAFVVDDN